MKPDKNTDITERMIEMLRKHSVPYKEGAWERFKEYEAGQKKKVIIWPYLSGAAAVLLLGIVLFLRQNDRDILPAQRTALTERSIEDEMLAAPNNEEIELDAEEPKINGSRRADHVDNIIHRDRTVANTGNFDSRVSLIATDSLSRFEKNTDILVGDKESQYAINGISKDGNEGPVDNHSAIDDQANQQVGIQDDNVENTQSKTTYDRENGYQHGDWAFADNSESSLDLNKSFNRWNFSIEVAPNINEYQQINFGGGVAIAYNINDKLSISSGISYVQLDAQRGPNQVDIPAEFSKASLNSYNYNKSLNTINTTLVGLDIPVNLKVNLGTQVYASAGVSVFSVLSESRYNIFEEKIARVASLSADGKASPEPAIQTVYSQETSPNTPYEGKNFTGFFNLSVGYKLPALKNFNLSVEPYIKVPVGSLTDQDMNLGNGGLKIVTGF
ncbi:porin family protein [Albibacterium indicum]|uniref:hypothetical protein n=1 Tax=Albibacterium indicum TaxID=2292082 RepID=UPI000E495FE9|nr:hypothetical protein [Pedobacter indicus]